MISETSQQAYKSLTNVNDKQRWVLGVIEEAGPVTNHRISQLLGWEINRVTPRVNELCEMGKVEVAYVARSDTGRSAKFWKVKGMQGSLF